MRKSLLSTHSLKPFASHAMFLMAALLTSPTFAQNSTQNPWAQNSKPLIDESPISADSNSWREQENTQADGGYDESKYPPLDENAVLGIDYSASPYERPAYSGSWSGSQGGNQYLQIPNYEKQPVYPNNARRGFPSYNNRQYPTFQGGYQPGHRGSYGPGSNSGGGLPFFGNSGTDFPFSMGNSMMPSMGNGMMPFSNQGFW